MHNYSITNTKIRITAVSVIAIAAAYLTFLLNPVITLLPISLQPLSPFAAFGVLFFIFDKWVWKLWPLSKLLNIPNFNGTWKGDCQSKSKKANGKKINCTFKIKQTFTQIIIDGSFDSSDSASFAANVDHVNPYRAKLVYSYLNKPKGNAVQTQDKHIGTVELDLKNESELNGNYFTDRLPQSKGAFNLKKVKS